MARDMMQDNEIFILGHTHQPSIHQFGSKTIVNLGAHMRGFGDIWIEVADEHGAVKVCGKLSALL